MEHGAWGATPYQERKQQRAEGQGVGHPGLAVAGGGGQMMAVADDDQAF